MLILISIEPLSFSKQRERADGRCVPSIKIEHNKIAKLMSLHFYGGVKLIKYIISDHYEAICNMH